MSNDTCDNVCRKLDKAHTDALNMLKIIDEYCINEDIIYTIAGSTLVSYGYVDFCDRLPEISIAVEYEGYKRIFDYLSDYCNSNEGYSLHSYKNTKQFYTTSLWFVKKSRVVLGQQWKDEEFYYGTHIEIIPLFYAGDSMSAWKKTHNMFYKSILPCYYRYSIPKRPMTIIIQTIPKIIHSRKMLRWRDIDSFSTNIEKFENRNKSDYIYYPVLTTKYMGKNKVLDIMPNKIGRLTLSDFWNKVERIKYEGIGCYIVKDKNRLISLYHNESVEKMRTPIRSDISILSGEDIRRVQLVQLELLKEFDRICRKYDLKYNVNFGTLIGAVRHKGFVPWDDDIDVTMYYEDCYKLYDIMEKELDKEKYFYRCDKTEKYHHVIINHLERKETVYTKPGRDKLDHRIGIYIDIFPLYPAAPNRFLDFWHTRVCRFWRTSMWSTVAAGSEKKPLKRCYYRLLSKLGTERCRKHFEKAATRFKLKNGRLKLWTAMERSPYNVGLVRKENFDEAIEMKFEDITVWAPKYYEESLEYCFSKDWRLFPNVSSRKTHHDVVVDIGNLYSYENA